MGFATVKMEGVVTDIPELRWLGETPVTRFNVRVTRQNGNGKNTTFVCCKKFGSGAEELVKELRKGSLVWIEGSLMQERWGTKPGRLFVDAASIERRTQSAARNETA